jgi:IclR family transcriptional regulator, acetate operon repressor
MRYLSITSDHRSEAIVPVKQLSTVEKAFRVLVAISEHQPIGLTALARLLDLDRAAVQRILATLDAIGWIAPAAPASDGWELTPQALIIGRRCAPGLRTAARPLLEGLAADSGETGLLIMVDHGRVVVVDVVDSTQPLRVSVPLGFDAPLSDFEPFLAFFSEDELAALGLRESLSISSETTGTLRDRG